MKPRCTIKEVNEIVAAVLQSAKDEIERTEEYLKKELGDDYYPHAPSDLFHFYYDDGKCSYDASLDYGAEWRIGTVFEDGISTLIYKVKEKAWYLREPRNGTDTPISLEKAQSVAAGYLNCYLAG